MRVLFGCGGTGGHIYPAIAIADALKAQGCGLLFIGSQDGMELAIVAEAGYPIVAIAIQAFQRKQLIQNFRLPFLMAKSFYQARSALKSFKPDVVVGTGGYVSFPTLLSAYSQNIPILIQEQNSTAGLTNKLCARWATRVCTGYPEVSFPSAQEKVVFTGNPVRSVVYRAKKNRQEALTYFNFSSDKKCLLVVGGSGGAGQLNTAILDGLGRLQGIQLLWITGQRYFKAINDHLLVHYRDRQVTIRCYPFFKEMDLAYAAADVVISRAGALAIAELCVAQKPTILVPSPNVVGDHQTKNSLCLLNKQAVWLLKDQECPQLLVPTVLALLHDVAQQVALVQQMSAFSLLHGGALNKIVDEIVALGAV